MAQELLPGVSKSPPVSPPYPDPSPAVHTNNKMGQNDPSGAKFTLEILSSVVYTPQLFSVQSLKQGGLIL